MSIIEQAIPLLPEAQQRDAIAINSMEKTRDALYAEGDLKGAKDYNNRIIQAENRLSIWGESNPEAMAAIWNRIAATAPAEQPGA